MQNNDPPVVTYGNLSNLYAARSQFEKGFEVITKLIGRQPEIAAGHRYLANHLVQWVKLEEAKGALEKVESLAPGDLVLRPLIVRLRSWKRIGRKLNLLLNRPWHRLILSRNTMPVQP